MENSEKTSKESVMNNKMIYWIVYLIVAAFVILANALEFFPVQVSLLRLVISGALGAVVVGSIIKLNFYGIFIPLGLIGVIFAEEFRLTAITPFPIIVVAILLSIAFQLIFKKKV